MVNRMKIEKVNDNQIRCTLTKEDLASRELKISELAYGSEKAKSLFRDMMQQANFEFGFEAEDIPLMIEAIPMNAECIVLIITKVEDPEELDTRFSRFAPSIHEESLSDEEESFDMPNEVLEMAAPSEPQEDGDEKGIYLRLFCFESLAPLFTLAPRMANNYIGSSTLYKDNEEGVYLLLLMQEEGAPENFNRTCNMISEYAQPLRTLTSTPFYLEEHCEILIADQVFQTLSK